MDLLISTTPLLCIAIWEHYQVPDLDNWTEYTPSADNGLTFSLRLYL